MSFIISKGRLRHENEIATYKDELDQMTRKRHQMERKADELQVRHPKLLDGCIHVVLAG